VQDCVFSTGSLAADDAAGLGDAVFGVLDPIPHARDVLTKFGVTDDDFEVVCLVKTLELFGICLENQSANSDACVSSRDFTCGGVICR